MASRALQKSLKVKTMCSFVRLLRLFAPVSLLRRTRAPLMEHNRPFVAIGPPRLGGELRAMRWAAIGPYEGQGQIEDRLSQRR